jgi:peroxiredoxin 5
MKLAHLPAAILLLFSAVPSSGFSAPSPRGIQVGDKVPWCDLHYGFPPQRINVAQHVAGRNVVIVGLPGAFTPTCSEKQIPGYIKHSDELRELGIDEVLVYSVNDGAVMRAWAIDQKIEGSLLLLMGDPYSEFTEMCGMELTHPIPIEKGLVNRCKRFAMLVVNNVVKHVAVSESEDDPAGDAHPEDTCAPAMIEAIKSLKLGGTMAGSSPPQTAGAASATAR